MDISIIIVNWNTPDLTLQCLESLFANAPAAALEVFVVDNASTDDSLDRIRAAFPQVKLLANPTNLGFGVANNVAMRQAQGRYVHLINSDVIILPGAIQALYDYMEAHLTAGASGSYYYNPDRSLQSSCYPFPTLSREAWRLFHLDRLRTYGVYAMQRWDPTAPRPVDVLQGASLFLRRSALDQGGFFDPDYFMYTEEVDLCYRLRKAGWELVWVPESGVIHLGGQSTRQAAQEMFIELYRSKHIFFRKHYGAASAGLYRFILALSALTRLAASPLGSLQSEPGRSQSRAVAANYRKLLQVLHEF